MTSRFELEDSHKRYDEWLHSQRKNELLPKERLIPLLEVPVPNEPPALMQSKMHINEDQKKDLLARVQALIPWGGYVIQLADGVLTGSGLNSEHTIYRAHLICNAVKQLAGKSFADYSVLDMACNHGYIGLQCAFDGAKETLGCDLRKANIKKAQLLKEHFEIENASFKCEDVYQLDTQFDVVLNLGLLYHVTDPYLLIAKTYDTCRQFAVVDTITHLAPVSAFIQRTNKNNQHHAEGRYNVEYQPTYHALLDLMHAVGFKDLVEVVPAPSTPAATHPLYDAYQRRCIIGFK